MILDRPAELNMNKLPKVSVAILVIKENKILLGLLTKNWMYMGKQVYGVPGTDIKFREKMGDAVKRNIREEFGCGVKEYKIISVNANYALGNHYIGIGIQAEIDGEPKLLIPQDWEKWEWFNKGKIPKNLFPAAEYLIKCYMEKKITVSE